MTTHPKYRHSKYVYPDGELRLIWLRSQQHVAFFGVLSFMGLLNVFAINFWGPSWSVALLFNIFIIMLVIFGAYLYRKSYVFSFRLKLLQDLLGRVAQDCFVFDLSGKLIFAHSSQKISSYLDLVSFLEKYYQHYFPSDNLLQKMRLSQISSGLLTRRCDNALFLCEHVAMECPDFHVVLLKNMTSQFQMVVELDQQHKKLQRFLDDASFGLLYVDSHDVVVGANDAALRYLGKMGSEVINQSASAVLSSNSSTEPELDDDMGIPLQSTYTSEGAEAANYIIYKANSIGENAVYLIIPHEESQSSCYDLSRIPSVVMDCAGDIQEKNANFAKLFPKINNFFAAIHPSTRTDIEAKFESEEVHPFEFRFADNDVFVTAYASPMKTKTGKGYLLQFVDISEQKQLEQQVIQSQKMQAVGQLAGGVAHDFNNLLTAIIGYSDLLLQRFLPNDAAYTDLIQIKQNANRASNLVRQLLAFSRQQNLQFKCLNITDVLSEVSTLLKRLLGATITVNVQHGQNLWPVQGDFGQFEQVFINLAVNARDAMKNEGTLTIATSNYTIANDRRMGADVLPKGEYVCIEVEDTGCGIPPDMIDRIFDPFFSTKEVGAGTGLGLSTVYGIVKQCGGYIDVKSSSLGTTFVIYLPHYEGEVPVEKPEADMVVDLTGHARILLIEDEDAVRTFSARALREKGYEVTEASSGAEALEIIEKGGVFDLIISDVVMPKMDGPTFCQKLRDTGCTTRMIFMSGYSEDTFRNTLTQDGAIHFLPKPYNIQDLALKVKTVLG